MGNNDNKPASGFRFGTNSRITALTQRKKELQQI